MSGLLYARRCVCPMYLFEHHLACDLVFIYFALLQGIVSYKCIEKYKYAIIYFVSVSVIQRPFTPPPPHVRLCPDSRKSETPPGQNGVSYSIEINVYVDQKGLFFSFFLLFGQRTGIYQQ